MRSQISWLMIVESGWILAGLLGSHHDPMWEYLSIYKQNHASIDCSLLSVLILSYSSFSTTTTHRKDQRDLEAACYDAYKV